MNVWIQGDPEQLENELHSYLLTIGILRDRFPGVHDLDVRSIPALILHYEEREDLTREEWLEKQIKGEYMEADTLRKILSTRLDPEAELTYGLPLYIATLQMKDHFASDSANPKELVRHRLMEIILN